MKIADIIAQAAGGIAELDGTIAAFDGKQTIRFYREQRTDQVTQGVYKAHFVSGHFEVIDTTLHRDDLTLSAQLDRYVNPFAVIYSGYDGGNLAQRAEYERGRVIGDLRTGGAPSAKHKFNAIDDAVQFLSDRWSEESHRQVDLDQIYEAGALKNPGELGWQWVIVPRNLTVDVMSALASHDPAAIAAPRMQRAGRGF